MPSKSSGLLNLSSLVGGDLSRGYITAPLLVESRKIFTLDRGDFESYRVRRRHRGYTLEIV